MTEKQSKAIDLLTNIIMLEAIRVKALNEEGADLEEYDNTEIETCLIKASDYKGVFDGITLKILKEIINESLKMNNFEFSDNRCYSYLFDVIFEDIKSFL